MFLSSCVCSKFVAPLMTNTVSDWFLTSNYL